VIKEADIVISALAYPQLMDQLKIIDAIKVAGNIKVIFLLIIAKSKLYIFLKI